MVKRNENGGKLKLSYSLYHIGKFSFDLKHGYSITILLM